MHYERWRKHGDAGPAAKKIASRGEGCVTPTGYRITAGKFDHRSVMEDHIGRPLIPGETIHHRNGDRADNRIENLELWSKSQPAGQRVADKLAWAQEIVTLYGPLAEKHLI